MIIIQFINKLALMLALGILYNFLTKKFSMSSLQGRILAGILFGFICIVGMSSPVVLENGVIFDGRSLITAVSGVFGGPVTAIITATIAIIYRIYLGGIGTLTGIIVIVTSSLLGILYYFLHLNKTRFFKWQHIYLFGLIVHLLMLVSMLTLPTEMFESIKSKIILPVLIFYPIATLFLILILFDLEKKNDSVKQLNQSEERLRLSTEVAGVAVWEYDFVTNSMSRSKNHDKLYGLEWQENWDISTFLNATHPEDREASNQIIQDSVAPGGGDRYEKVNLGKTAIKDECEVIC